MEEASPLVKKKKQRNGKIELMRFVMAVIIACYHFGCSVKYPGEWFERGYLAVEFFFVVSGYLFASSLMKYGKEQQGDLVRSSLLFMAKKYRSFIWYYLVVIVMTVVAWIPFFHLNFHDWLLRVIHAIPTFFLVQMAGLPTADWFVPVWYLSAMLIVMFILTPVMIKWGRTYALYIAPVLSLLLIGFIWKQGGTLNVSTMWKDNWFNAGLARALAEVSIGCTCCYIVKSGILNRVNRWVLSLIGFLCYLPPLICMTVGMKQIMEVSVTLLLIAAVLITFQNSSTFTFLNNRFVYFLGTLSLPVFLCHSIARYYIVDYYHLDLGYPKTLGVFLLVTFALSAVCVIGGKLLQMTAKWISGRRKPPKTAE